jgi:CHAT domain-containing protein
MAGYSTVIATIWWIEDEGAPLIAEEVYQHLLRGVSDSRKASEALHMAVGCLRDRIHIGL